MILPFFLHHSFTQASKLFSIPSFSPDTQCHSSNLQEEELFVNKGAAIFPLIASIQLVVTTEVIAPVVVIVPGGGVVVVIVPGGGVKLVELVPVAGVLPPVVVIDEKDVSLGN